MNVIALLCNRHHLCCDSAFAKYALPVYKNIAQVARKKLHAAISDLFVDPVRSNVALLSFLDEASKDSPALFQRNLQYGAHRISKEAIEKVCRSTYDEHAQRLLVNYRIWASIDGRRKAFSEIDKSELGSALDGIYWQQTK